MKKCQANIPQPGRLKDTFDQALLFVTPAKA